MRYFKCQKHLNIWRHSVFERFIATRSRPLERNLWTRIDCNQKMYSTQLPKHQNPLKRLWSTVFFNLMSTTIYYTLIFNLNANFYFRGEKKNLKHTLNLILISNQFINTKKVAIVLISKAQNNTKKQKSLNRFQLFKYYN